MARRGRSKDALTGGTGDVNPQTMQYLMNPAISGTSEEWALMTPFARMPRVGNMVTIMEIIKVEYWFPGTPTPGGAGFQGRMILYCSTRPDSGGLHMPGCIDQAILEYDIPTAALWGGVSTTDRVVRHDMTDGQGHGMLVATDAIYVGGIGNAVLWIHNTGAGVRIWYRFKNVSLTEYIGIVQSQQS